MCSILFAQDQTDRVLSLEFHTQQLSDVLVSEPLKMVHWEFAVLTIQPIVDSTQDIQRLVALGIPPATSSVYPFYTLTTPVVSIVFSSSACDSFCWEKG